MKKRKQLIISFLIFLNIILGINIASAQSQETVINMWINNPVMTVNGAETEIDPGEGTTPIIVNERTLVPIRVIIESLGGSVDWNDTDKTTTLTMDGNTIMLVIDSTTAYYNNKAQTIDTAPVIINDRTMLPIRFVAEKFGFSVDWDGGTQKITITKGSRNFSFSVSDVPAFSGSPYVAINNNTPMFYENEITSNSFEYYSPLDSSGRCGVCVASVGPDIMPTEERESISSITPSGWQSIPCDVPGGYLYNRCHLIGFQLTAENANYKNLITGTRYLNIEGMLPFENMVADYIKETGNHVMYRATPVFEGNNLIASGILLEGYSVEDKGDGISFCVYCYNVQPTILIDYSTGYCVLPDTGQNDITVSDATYILNTNTKKFHYPSCSSVKRMSEKNKSGFNGSRDKLISQGYSPCENCNP